MLLLIWFIKKLTEHKNAETEHSLSQLCPWVSADFVCTWKITLAIFGIFTLQLILSRAVTTTLISKNYVNIKKTPKNNSVSTHVSTSASMCVITVWACWIIQCLPSANTDINWRGTIKDPGGEPDTAFSPAAVVPHFTGARPSASGGH